MVGRQGVCFIRGHIGEVGEVEDQVGAPFGYGVPDICVGKEVVDGRLPMLVGVLVTSRKPQERVVERRIRYAYRLIEPPDLAINQLMGYVSSITYRSPMTLFNCLNTWSEGRA